MERCPVCRARLNDGPVCRRCGTDLTLALLIEARAEQLVREAVQCMARHDWPGAEHAVQEALRLRQGSFARTLLGFIQQHAPATIDSGLPRNRFKALAKLAALIGRKRR